MLFFMTERHKIGAIILRFNIFHFVLNNKRKKNKNHQWRPVSHVSPTIQDVRGVKHESGDVLFNNERPQFSRGAPSWMKNYEVYEIRKIENTVSHFFIFEL